MTRSTTSPNAVSPRLSVSSSFDSGNIDVVDLSNPLDIQLRLRPDPYCHKEKTQHFQWFHYRITGVRDRQLCMKIVNAGDASFTDGWPGYRACASYNRTDWFRVDTSYDTHIGVLSVKHKPTQDAVYYAYFSPYTYERHLSLVASMQDDDLVEVEVLGHTVDGRGIDLIKIGEGGANKVKVWVIARQHPGESMAEWFAEGMMKRLLDRDEALSQQLLRDAVFYVVPNMCPDGSQRGHLRSNATGANLNREWADPTDLHKAPEVYHVKRKMDAVGADLFLDVHGDESVAANYIIGNEDIPSWTDHMMQVQERFLDAFHRAAPDFLTKTVYAAGPPGSANLAIAGPQINERFKCPSYTIEMPFKDTELLPDPVHGFSDKRAMQLGAAVLNPIAEVMPLLR